ncbi:MAG TPA: Holliday junction branch migration DNA helicase RuvB [Coprothermobacter proteolyticus]|uniref:Holliday junction branch migration DNA helicase RuvB n=1 Tax=Coprothermobacter proteolyticus TaxID=35786 RepID=UPI000D322D59|nr:Holliday junction branch migration DNA helicase RuvB [Coprothermobacter proteolyticus]MBP8983871.1 Holliday junction branch migration DNA helicase RuvB [Coprothermobacter sp.]HOA64745.1 Holliday junction branch migration DNA helicase RuvB [Coprothermobacter proteolyticus]
MGNKGTQQEGVMELKEFVGQTTAVSSVSFSVEAAKKLGKMPDHMLFFGPPGLGKTTLARLVAQEVAANFVETTGNSLSNVKDVLNILLSFSRPTVFFIDEIHRIPKSVEELLYAPMDEQVIRVMVGKNKTARIIKFDLQPFTLIGATTKISFLSKPFLSRFSIKISFNYYGEEEIGKIIKEELAQQGLDISAEALREIAKRSRGTPREALQICRRVVEYAALNHLETLDVGAIIDLFNLLNIDEYGLSPLDKDYLRTLAETFKGGPSGIRVLASALGMDVETLEGVVEPYLMMLGFVTVTSRGRKLTDKGWKAYEKVIRS